MSLRVWLPLNGTLDNQGLDDVIVTNNGATIDNSGKIGKCYGFDTSNSSLTIDKKAMTNFNSEASVCFWIKIIDWNTKYATFFQAGLGGVAWNNYIFGFLRNNGNSNCCFTISNGSSATNANYLTPNLNLNEWYHIGLVYKTGYCLIYINGVLYQKYTTNIVPKFSDIKVISLGVANNLTGYQTKCKLNDVRIYDHALSPLEVKQISQGLILHYPLNNNSVDNNIEYDCSGYCNNGIKIGNFQYSDDTPKYNYSTYFKATNQKIHIDNLNTIGFSDSYSFAWWGKESSVAPMFWGFSDGIRLNGLYQGTLWNTGDGNNNPIYEPNTTIKITAPSINTWHHYVMVGDKIICKLYIDGQLYGQAKTYKSINGTSIYINGWDSATHYSHNNMYMSDFRIYCTALSAEDILALYKNSVYIDNEGNLYGTELREV